jgi:glutathione S-transferase
MSQLRLYVDDRWQSPYTYSVYSALREKGIQFDLHETHFRDGRFPDAELAGKTYTDLIPALEHGGLVVSESLAILEYLEEVFPSTSLYPASVADRARARFLLSWYRCSFHALRDERSTETIFYEEKRAKAPLSQAAREEIADWMKALRDFRRPGSEFIFGRWTIADTETALMLQRLIRNGDELDADLKAYAESLWKRPSMAEFVERRRPAWYDVRNP